MATRLGRLPVIRTFKHHPAVERAWNTGYRSRLVRERARFTAREVSGLGRTGAYHLAGSGRRVHLRHGSSDLDILEEVFGMGLYAMPPAVRSLLAGCDPLRVLDLGGHVGLFGAWVLGEFPAARVTAVEADPANAAVQQRTIEASDPGSHWRLIQAVAAPATGHIAFRVGGYAESGIAADDPDARLLPSVDALGLMAGADLAKIDIEGGEWPILADERFASSPVRAIALEYHPSGCPTGDYRAEAHRVLHEAGFTTQDIEPAPAGAGMLWAWRA